jgi:hypothetical protein
METSLQGSACTSRAKAYSFSQYRGTAYQPSSARIILQLEGDEEFNAWSERVGRSHLEPNQPVLYVVIKKLRPDRSRIQELDLVKV